MFPYSQFPVHGTRLTRRNSIVNFQCLAYVSANSSLCVPVPRVVVDAQTMAALLHLHGLTWYVMLACASQRGSMPRLTTHVHHLVKPSDLGQLAVKLERLITN